MKFKLFQTEKDIYEINKLKGIKENVNELAPKNLAFEKITKPWGYEYLLYEDIDFAIWLLYLAPNSGTSLHCHLFKHTTIIIIEGEVTVEGLDKKMHLKDFNHVEIDKSTFHRSHSTTGAYLLEVEKPNQKFDLVRLQDEYGRENSNYEGKEHYKKIKRNHDFVESIKLINSKMQLTKIVSNKEIYIGPIDRLTLVDLNTSKSKCVILNEKNLNSNQFKGKILNESNVNERHKILNILSISNIIEQQNGSNLIAEILQKINAEIFSSVGDLNLHLVEALARNEGVKLNLFPNDDIALKAMSAYAKISKNRCIFIPSTSSETLDAIPKIISNWIDSNPLTCLIIDADFHKKVINSKLRQGFNKGFPLVELLKLYRKSTLKMFNLNKSNYKKLQNFLSSKNYENINPKIVLLSPQVCTQMFKIKRSFVSKLEKRSLNIRKSFIKRLTRKINYLKIIYFSYLLIRSITKSKKFMVIIGDGVKKNEILYFFIKMLESLEIPIFTTRSAIGLLNTSSPSYYGRIGGYGCRISNHFINTADLILVIGSRLSTSLVTRSFENFAPTAKKFVVDIDRNELNKSHLKQAKKLKSDSETFLEYFNESLKSLQFKLSLFSINRKLREIYNKYNPHAQYQVYPKTNIYRFINDVTESFSDNDYIVVDGGALLHYVNQAAIVKRDQTWINLSSLEQSGYALSAAIGVFAHLENLNIDKSRIKVFCEANSVFKSLESIQYINSNNLPIDIFIISHGENNFINVSQNIIYPYSYVGREVNDTYNSLRNILMSLTHYNVIEWNSDNKNILCDNEKNNIVIFTLDINQEMVPRPSFITAENGKWKTKSLTQMDPKDSIDEMIRMDLERL